METIDYPEKMYVGELRGELEMRETKLSSIDVEYTRSDLVINNIEIIDDSSVDYYCNHLGYTYIDTVYNKAFVYKN